MLLLLVLLDRPRFAACRAHAAAVSDSSVLTTRDARPRERRGFFVCALAARSAHASECAGNARRLRELEARCARRG